MFGFKTHPIKDSEHVFKRWTEQARRKTSSLREAARSLRRGRRRN